MEFVLEKSGETPNRFFFAFEGVVFCCEMGIGRKTFCVGGREGRSQIGRAEFAKKLAQKESKSNMARVKH